MKIYFVLFLFVACLLVLFTPYTTTGVKSVYYVRSQKHEIPSGVVFTAGNPLALKKAVLEKLVDTLRSTVDIFERNSVEYWLTGHLLHGVQLVEGILPWDDNAVLAVNYTCLDKLIQCRPYFEQQGYSITKHSSGFRICRIQLVQVPSIEIVLVDRVKEEMLICSPLDDLNKCTFADSFMRRNEINSRDSIFPLQKLRFEDFYVSCPKDPGTCLKTFYSTNDTDVVQSAPYSLQAHLQSNYVLKYLSTVFNK
jgi:hypothetical protein